MHKHVNELCRRLDVMMVAFEMLASPVMLVHGRSDLIFPQFQLAEQLVLLMVPVLRMPPLIQRTAKEQVQEHGLAKLFHLFGRTLVHIDVRGAGADAHEVGEFVADEDSAASLQVHKEELLEGLIGLEDAVFPLHNFAVAMIHDECMLDCQCVHFPILSCW